MSSGLDRRRFAFGAGIALLALPAGPAWATKADVAAKIKEIAGATPIRKGRVKIDLPVLVESANSVSLRVSVEQSLPHDQRVLSFHVFAEGNPLPNVAHFHFGPRAGRRMVATRIRLADSQTVIALAKCADGSIWLDSIEVLVALAACLD
ncbi:MAG: sulfur oxidation protein SoxY [Alphaproteobacteria bacterium]|nr:sulfur oxidation protein SoxY [Alphaproteobacteria bacterium]